MSRFWRLQLAALCVGFAWLLGTCVLDWVGVENWVYLLWSGMIVATWLIGGNILSYWRRQDERHKLVEKRK